jgi:uncharacterized UPF0160 family protein
MLWLKNKKIVAVHSGNFHADDVFAVATLSILFNGRIKIIRSRDEKELSTADYVLDVGRVYDPKANRFDHHQGVGQRANGIPYSAFGLVWKEFGGKVSGSVEAAQIIEKRLVQVLDADDNAFALTSNLIEGVSHYTISDYIINVCAATDSRDYYKKFVKLVDLAIEVLKVEIKLADLLISGRKISIEAYQKAEDKRLIILDQDVNWSILSDYPEPLFVIKPSDTIGAWKLYTVREKGDKFKNRFDLPKAWGNKEGADLASITGVDDALYCHHGLYMAMAKSKEGTIKLAKLALEQTK